MPLIGAISEASRSAILAESSAASAAATCALALSSWNFDESSAIGEMNLSLARPTLESYVRCAWASVVLTAARLARIAPAAEAGTRSIGVAVQLQNPKETMRAGQYAVAQVQISDATPRLTVPLGAISSASGQEYVWTVEAGKLLRRTVTTGRHDQVRGRAEVLQGLSPDMPVLGARFDNLREGAKARIVAVATAATPKPLDPVAPAAATR